MRYGCAALFVLMLSASASAQGGSTQFAPEPLQMLTVLQALQPPGTQATLSADDVLARVMTFDSDRDGRVATAEFSERMQGLVARGDKSGDGALDESEIRLLATAQQFVVRARQNLGGGYGFADTTLSSRHHIENSIDDLRLTENASQEAKRIALAFADEFEAAALANLRKAVAPVITEQQLAQFEANLTRFNGLGTVQIHTGGNGTASSVSLTSTSAALTMLLVRQQLPAEQMKALTSAVETFKAGQQLDDARRSELMARLQGVLTEEERDNLSAALARRPLVRRAGSFAGFPALNAEHGLTINAVVR